MLVIPQNFSGPKIRLPFPFFQGHFRLFPLLCAPEPKKQVTLSLLLQYKLINRLLAYYFLLRKSSDVTANTNLVSQSGNGQINQSNVYRNILSEHMVANSAL